MLHFHALKSVLLVAVVIILVFFGVGKCDNYAYELCFVNLTSNYEYTGYYSLGIAAFATLSNDYAEAVTSCEGSLSCASIKANSVASGDLWL